MDSVTPTFLLKVFGVPALAFAALLGYIVVAGGDRTERHFATFDTAREQIGNALPDDLPASATSIQVTWSLDSGDAMFSWDAPSDALPKSCRPRNGMHYACGSRARPYTIHDDDGHWVGESRQ